MFSRIHCTLRITCALRISKKINMIYYKLCLAVILTCNSCLAHKFLLVFPIPGRSHGILGEGFVRNLLKADHEVVYITAVPLNETNSRLRQIDVSENIKLYPEFIFKIEWIMKTPMKLTDAWMHLMITYNMSVSTINNADVQRLMMDTSENFDAVIAEWLYSELYAGFSAVFNCPLIWSSSMEPHNWVLSLIDDYANPAYTTDNLSLSSPPFTFMERIIELWKILWTLINKWFLNFKEIESYNILYGPAASKRGITLPPFNEVKYNGSLMLGNSHVSTGQNIRLPQNYKSIGGYHLREDLPKLPKQLQEILDNSKHGVIFFSMGTMLKSKYFPDDLKIDLIKMFGSLKQEVIWKLEDHNESLPKNLHIVQWAPQSSILAHPNCVLFITHGGLLSVTEAIHFAVPFIGIPMYGDQYINVIKSEDRGFAKQTNLHDGVNDLKSSIEDMLNNSSYRDKMNEFSFIYHHRPASPSKELVHWVEHVVRTRGAPHLRSPALHVPFYQKMYLDLVALIVLSILIIKRIIRSYLLPKRTIDLTKKRS
ncbi:UDP-glucosyltransferase 2-like [Aphomia sociella]